jgi:hypothetical protein
VQDKMRRNLHLLAGALLLAFAINDVRSVCAIIQDSIPRLAGQQFGVNEGDHSTLRDDYVAQELVQSTATLATKVLNAKLTHSSSFRMANCKWRGTIRCFCGPHQFRGPQ